MTHPMEPCYSDLADDLERVNDRLRARIAELDAEMDGLRKDVFALTAERDGWRAQVNDDRAAMASCLEDSDCLHVRIAELEDERDAFHIDALRFGCAACSRLGHRLCADYCTECGQPMVKVLDGAAWLTYVEMRVRIAELEHEAAIAAKQLNEQAADYRELEARLALWKRWEHSWIFGDDAPWPGHPGTADPRDTVDELLRLALDAPEEEGA